MGHQWNLIICLLQLYSNFFLLRISFQRKEKHVRTIFFLSLNEIAHKCLYWSHYPNSLINWMKTLPFKNVVSLTLDFCPTPYPGGHILMLHWIVCTAGRVVGTQLSSVTIRFLSLSKHTILVCCTPEKIS